MISRVTSWIAGHVIVILAGLLSCSMLFNAWQMFSAKLTLAKHTANVAKLEGAITEAKGQQDARRAEALEALVAGYATDSKTTQARLAALDTRINQSSKDYADAAKQNPLADGCAPGDDRMRAVNEARDRAASGPAAGNGP